MRRRFLWSPLSVVVELESERGLFGQAVVTGVVDVDAVGVAGRIKPNSQKGADGDRACRWHPGR